jgi:hypothetical protein
MTLDTACVLRAGNAQRWVCAERAGAKAAATLDAVMAGNAKRLKLKAVVFASVFRHASRPPDSIRSAQDDRRKGC